MALSTARPGGASELRPSHNGTDTGVRPVPREAPPPPHHPSFDLVDEPWLPCVRVDGGTAMVSLRQALTDAHQIRDLIVDIPSQYPPILRLLLAVTHRAVGTADRPGPRSSADWAALWQMGQLPATGTPEPSSPLGVGGYLDQVGDRFDLFHPHAPFLQVAGLEGATGPKTVALLIPHLASGNNAPLVSSARDDAPPALTAAEAARWLLHAHAWDTASIKTAATGDPHGRGGKTYSNPAGPLGLLGVLIPTGPTLWHTLLYNLRILDDERLNTPADLPVWERDPLTPRWRERTPTGLLDLYTWPARRIRLITTPTPDGTRVRQVLVCGGDRLGLHQLHGIDPHTAWRRSPTQEKKLELPVVYMPVAHQPGRQLWRGLGTLLAHAHATGPDRPARKTSDLLRQVGRFADTHLAGHTVKVRGIGISYGTQNAVVDDTYHDELPLPVAVLRGTDSPWEPVALDAVQAADAAATRVAALAGNLAKASGCDDDKLLAGRRDEARNRLYTDLDPRFRRWIAGLGDPGDPRTERDRWRATVRAAAWAIAEDLIMRAPPGAARGHTVQTTPGTTVRVTTALAETWFRAGLTKDLPTGPAKAPASQPQETPA